MTLILPWQRRSLDQRREFLLARACCFQTLQTGVDASVFSWEDSRIAGNNHWSLQKASWLSVDVSLQSCDRDNLLNFAIIHVSSHCSTKSHLSQNNVFAVARTKCLVICNGTTYCCANTTVWLAKNCALQQYYCNNSIYMNYGKWSAFANLVAIVTTWNILQDCMCNIQCTGIMCVGVSTCISLVFLRIGISSVSNTEIIITYR